MNKHETKDSHGDMPVVPSISNIDDMETEDFIENLPFSQSDAEPEAILDIPSFSGLDTLDITTAVTEIIDELEYPNFQDFQDFQENVPVSPEETATDTAQIPSFLDTSDAEPDSDKKADTFFPASDIPEFTASQAGLGIGDMPEIPSFSDQDESEIQNMELENLPDISAFSGAGFSEHPQEPTGQTTRKEKLSTFAELGIPEKPADMVLQEDFQEEQALLPQVPSVSDFENPETIPEQFQEFAEDADTLAIMREFQATSFLTEAVNEEHAYLPEIPSVIDENWEEKETSVGMAAGEIRQGTENDEPVVIAELPLSLKALHCLQKIEIHDSLQLLEATREELESIPEIDAKTLREILHVRQLRQGNLAKNISQQPVSEEFETLLEAFLQQLELIGVTEKRQIRLKSYLRAVSPERADRKTCFAAWYHESHVQLQLDKYMTGLLRKRQMSGLSVDMLAESLPPSLDRQILMELLQEMLSADRLIESRDGFYTLRYPPVLKFLSDNTDEKEQHIAVLQKRMDGLPLAQIAEDTHHSKAHVLEVQNKMLRLVQKLCLINRTSVYEERFRPLYETYELNQEQFIILTKETAQVFRYLELVAFPGSRNPEEILHDPGVPGWVRENWKKHLHLT